MFRKLVIILLRLFLLALAVLALYYIIPFNLAEIQVRSVPKTLDHKDTNIRALHWNPQSKEALVNLAELSKIQGDLEKAKNYALQSLSIDPTNGQAMSILIVAYEQSKDSATSEKAVTLAPKLWTAHSYVHSTLADYWAGKGDVKKVFTEWDLLITRHRSLYKPIFPILLSYANSEGSRHILTPYVSKPAPWWNDFYTYMVKNKVSLPVLHYFYQLRTQSNKPLEKNERRAYIQRLQQENLWKFAYSVWITGLTGNEFGLIGALYDGGFESYRHDTAYDWHFRQSKQAKITLGKTRGIHGKRALHIVFNRRKSISFSHVWQRLLLDPKRAYKVSMKTRIDALKNPAGLVWRVRCADKSKKVLAQSTPLFGKQKWHEISFDFTIPKQGCKSQLIRLEAASKYHHEHFFDGGIWFDQIKISPQK